MAPDCWGGLSTSHWMARLWTGRCLEPKVQVWLCCLGWCQWAGGFPWLFQISFNSRSFQEKLSSYATNILQPLAGNTGWTSCGNAFPPNVTSFSNRWYLNWSPPLAPGWLLRSKLMDLRTFVVLSCAGRELKVSTLNFKNAFSCFKRKWKSWH